MKSFLLRYYISLLSQPYHTVSMEPGEGSDNIEERKKSRRDRVSSILTLRGAETTDFATQVESDSAKQIAISLAQLDKIKLLGIGTVTSTRIDNDIREAKVCLDMRWHLIISTSFLLETNT